MMLRIESVYDDDGERHFETVGTNNELSPFHWIPVGRIEWSADDTLEEVLRHAMGRFPVREDGALPVCRPARDGSGDWIVTDSPNATVLAE